MAPNGQGVVVWTTPGPDAALFAVRFSGAGQEPSEAIRIADDAQALPQNPSVVVDTGGVFTVAWDQLEVDGSFGSLIFPRRSSRFPVFRRSSGWSSG